MILILLTVEILLIVVNFSAKSYDRIKSMPFDKIFFQTYAN